MDAITQKRKKKSAMLRLNLAVNMKSKTKMRMIDTLIAFLNDGFKNGEK